MSPDAMKKDLPASFSWMQKIRPHNWPSNQSGPLLIYGKCLKIFAASNLSRSEVAKEKRRLERERTPRDFVQARKPPTQSVSLHKHCGRRYCCVCFSTVLLCPRRDFFILLPSFHSPPYTHVPSLPNTPSVASFSPHHTHTPKSTHIHQR